MKKLIVLTVLAVFMAVTVPTSAVSMTDNPITTELAIQSDIDSPEVIIQEAGLFSSDGENSFKNVWDSVLLPIIVILLGFFFIERSSGKISTVAGKSADVSERIAGSLDALALVAGGAGLEKVSNVVKEIADIPDELGDVAQLIADKTMDGKFTKEEALEVLQAGKEVLVEGKEVVLMIKPKN